jgi:nitrate reductase gamma subunit
VNSNVLGHHDYRETVAPYFRSIFYLQPQGELMTASTFLFQAHVMSAWLLFAVWPFTRLVHVFSAPLGYLTRPYIVYRSREHTAGSRAPKPGWEPVGSGRR